MHTKNSINMKSLSLFKNTMAPRRRSSDDEDYNPLVRKKLPRRCKSIQPFYAIDIEYEDEVDDDHNPRNMKKKGLDDIPTEQKQEQGLVPRKPRKVMKNAHNKMVVEQELKDDETKISSSILSWLIEMKVIQENSLVVCVQHLTQGTEFIVGKLEQTEISCTCCEDNNIHSFSGFFTHHLGHNLADDLCEKIYLGNPAISLLKCQIEAWNRHSIPARSGYHHIERRPSVQDDYDDCCMICADGGQLICCDNCPSTYHYDCAGIKVLPEDDWHCPYCRCNICSRATNEMLHTCFQCLKKYHWSCSNMSEHIYKLFQLPNSAPFCGKECNEVYCKLEEKLGKSNAFPGELSWTIVRRTDLDGPGQHLKSQYTKAYCNSMVVLAAKLMEDSFQLIVDRQTRTNIIQSVVYSCGSNLIRTNFSRFYTAILEHDGHVVCVASFRIPSPKIAEIPFIATTELKRKQGLCKLLLSMIEQVLVGIGVKKIVIPSSDEMVINWIEKFGFEPLDEETHREIKKLNTLMFPRTTRLMKIIFNQDLNSLPVARV